VRPSYLSVGIPPRGSLLLGIVLLAVTLMGLTVLIVSAWGPSTLSTDKGEPTTSSGVEVSVCGRSISEKHTDRQLIVTLDVGPTRGFVALHFDDDSHFIGVAHNPDGKRMCALGDPMPDLWGDGRLHIRVFSASLDNR
jgi:hypothetical protein